MKKKRIICALVALAISLALTISVINEWKNNGCETESLIAAGTFYNLFIWGIWACVDMWIKGRGQ